MGSVLTTSILAIYYTVLGVLAFYGAHRLVLVALYYRSRMNSVAPTAVGSPCPVVTVQLPLYNERYVATRLIDAVCRLDYPRDALEIQVLDDSNDATVDLVAARVAHFRAAGFAIHHLRRPDRKGFKAGALAIGLSRAGGELVAIFDADFVPQPDFLRRIVPHFSDPRVGLVQARWDHINRDYSLLTKIQAILLDGHFAVEHAARHGSGHFFNFNGTAGVWRRQAIVDAGGWQHDTLTEDLDISYRAQLAGWRFVFRPEVATPAELPVDVNAFKRQQFRWAKGSMQTCRKLLTTVLRAAIPWTSKLEAFIHLTNNSCYFLMTLLSLLVFPAMFVRRGLEPGLLLALDSTLFLAATGSVALFYTVSQLAVGHGWRPAVKAIPALMGLGIGLSVNNTRAVISGLLRNGGIFERTPKYRIESPEDPWRTRDYSVGRNLSVLFERLLALYSITCFVAAWRLGMWWSIPFLCLFVHGYTYMTLLSILPERLLQRLAVTDAARFSVPTTQG